LSEENVELVRAALNAFAESVKRSLRHEAFDYDTSPPVRHVGEAED
jgi:hypothetical protein